MEDGRVSGFWSENNNLFVNDNRWVTRYEYIDLGLEVETGVARIM